MKYKGIINPLDLKEILVSNLAGSMEIFFLLSVVFFAYLAARFRMPNQIFLILMVIFSILAAILGYTKYLSLVIVIVGLFAFFVIGRLIKRR